MPEEELNTDQTAFEASLAALRPTAVRLDRDRLMYLAGQAAARAERPAAASPTVNLRRTWPWPCAVAASLAVALGVGWFRPRTVERVVYVERPSEVTPRTSFAAVSNVEPVDEPENRPPQPAGEPDYLRLRELVLLQGVDAMPSPHSGTPSPDDIPTRGDTRAPLLNRLLGG